MILSRKVRKRVKKKDNLRLTPKQFKMAEALADPDASETKSELCRRFNVSRSTFYEWMKKKEFTDYVSSLIDKHTDSQLGYVWNALLNRCKSGDISAIKLLFELKGRYKQQPDISSGLKVIFEDGENVRD